MKAEVKPGQYVVAVSGGVDSMALLHLLAQKKDGEWRRENGGEKGSNSRFHIPPSSPRFLVAHFNHGIRPDAHLDEELVAQTAAAYGLQLETGHGNLGPAASEDAARKARYEFLRAVMKKHQTDAIITAHHRDDVLETAIINLVRGTGRKGLSAIVSNPQIVRPLINVPKEDIIKYARANKLNWREDVTNQDESYLRNYIRRRIISKMTHAQKRQLLRAVDSLAGKNKEIDELVEILSGQIMSRGRIDRRLFTALPANIASEMVAYWLRQRGPRQLDRRKINRLSLLIKTAKPGTRHPVADSLTLIVELHEAYFAD